MLQRPAAALECLEQALHLCRETGDRHTEAASLHGMGVAHRDLGRHGEALASHQRALALRRQIGDQVGEAISLHRIGDLKIASGDPDGAQRAWRDALAICDKLGLPRAEEVRACLESLRR